MLHYDRKVNCDTSGVTNKRRAEERAETEGWIDADDLEKELGVFGVDTTLQETIDYWE